MDRGRQAEDPRKTDDRMNVDHPLYWTHILCRVDRGQQADDPPKTDDRMNVDERILCVEWTVAAGGGPAQSSGD